MPLKREIYSELSFYSALNSCSWWNTHMLLFACMMAGLSGWHNSKLMQANLIFIVFTQVFKNSGVFFHPLFCPVIYLYNYLPFSHFPYSHKHLGRQASLLCKHVVKQEIRCQSQLLLASLISTNQSLEIPPLSL